MITHSNTEKGVRFLVNKARPNNSLNSILRLLQKKIRGLEDNLLKYHILDDPRYKKWQDDFKIIYGEKIVNLQLYVSHSIYYLMGYAFIIEHILINQKDILILDKYQNIFKKVNEKMKKRFPNLQIFDFEYFDPVIQLLEEGHLNAYYSIITDITDFFRDLDIQPEYLFDYLTNRIISPAIRHKAGEYYTPPFLVKKMVEEIYCIGEKVLDPCCGSGNFLIEVIKFIMNSDKTEKEKKAALNNLHGYDINPISIFATKLNFLLLLNDKTQEIYLNLHVLDTLFINGPALNERFDLIIGNPPWYTFRDIESPEYQEKIKKLAENLEIKPLPKNILNIEISSLFFYHARNIFMKNDAKIFFVMTKGVINGSHASRFRNFNGFKNIKLWAFDKQIEKVFNIDFICLFAQKTESKREIFEVEIPSHSFTIKEGIEDLNYFDNVHLEIQKTEILIPYSIEKKAGKIYTKKLIKKELHKELLPTRTSFYKEFFHKGADLNPRNLIFVKVTEINDSLVLINPDVRIFKKAKNPWTKKEFKDQKVKRENIFNVIKSTELVKFGVFDYYQVFLPLSKIDLSFNYNSLSKYSRDFYDKINQIYLNLKKETTNNLSLMDNLNRWAKLINNRQLSQIKVVYNNSGSNLNSAIIQGDYIVTGDLSFYDTESLEEAYYLSAILNSPLMTKQIQIKKSSRHIFKIPLEIPIKKFDASNKTHDNLAKLGKKCHQKVQATITEFSKNNSTISKLKLQNDLNKKLERELAQIDEILLHELKS